MRRGRLALLAVGLFTAVTAVAIVGGISTPTKGATPESDVLLEQPLLAPDSGALSSHNITRGALDRAELPALTSDAGSPGDEGDPYPPALRALDQAACEIFDGIPARSSEGEVSVEIRAPGAVTGTLTVKYVITPGRFTTPDGKLNGDLSKSARITRNRVTLLRCRDRASVLELTLDDGLGARASREASVANALLTTTRPASVKGRLVGNGTGIKDARVTCYETAANRIATAWTDADGRFAFELFEQDPDQRCLLIVMASGWTLLDSPTPVYGPGTSVDLGDLRLEKESPIKPGLIGIALGDKAGEATITHVFEATPADRAGLATGDVVAEVDGVAVRSTQEAIQRIPGDGGTTVRLKIRRGAEYRLVDLKRQD